MNDLDDLEVLFSKHLNRGNNSINNNAKGFVQCSFTQEHIDNNTKMISDYEKNGLNQHKNFYCLEESELDNPIKTKKGDNFFETVIKNELENDHLYCGYLDNDDVCKIDTITKDNKQISCSYCFHTLSFKGTESSKGIFLCKKLDNIFKDYSETYTLPQIMEMIKDKSIHDELHFNDRFNEETSLKMFISIKCLDCSNLLGVKDTIIDYYILFNCI